MRGASGLRGKGTKPTLHIAKGARCDIRCPLLERERQQALIRPTCLESGSRRESRGEEAITVVPVLLLSFYVICE